MTGDPCPRCVGGWLYADPDPDDPGPVCVNCGHRPPRPTLAQYPVKPLPKTSSKIPPETPLTTA